MPAVVAVQHTFGNMKTDHPSMAQYLPQANHNKSVRRSMHPALRQNVGSLRSYLARFLPQLSSRADGTLLSSMKVVAYS